MQPLASDSNIVRFGVFQVDLRSGELHKAGLRVKLQQQPLRVLTLLLEHPNDVVGREELRAKLWPTDTFVDFEHSLNTAVRKLRDALGDIAENPVFIETIPRRGYRFIAPLEGSASAASGEPPAPVRIRPPETTLVTTPGVAAGKGKRSTLLVLGVVVVIGLIGTLAWKIALDGRIAAENAPRIRSLAVLPLTNLSGDPNEEYFADGMTEELTTDLGKIGALRVISRTSAMQYKGTKKSLPDIARELNVDAVIEGTVARSGSHLRITANLLQAVPEKHLWAESYESEVGDALTLQGQVAQAVARQIQINLTQREQKILSVARTVNPEAQDLALKGFFTIRGSENAEASEKAIKYFQQAIEKDPNYADAYLGLAIAHAVWIPGMTSGPRDLMPKAKEFALKALSLDSTCAEAHALLGMIELFYDWDWSTSEEEFKRTIALNPNSDNVYGWHSRGLAARGRREEAIAGARQMIALSPTPMSWDYPVWIFVLAHRYDLARERAEALFEVAPNWAWTHFEMAQVHEQQGKLEEAAQESLKADELFGTDPKKLAQLREAMARSGTQGYWRRTLANYRESAKLHYVPPVLVAQACVRVGDKECAFQWLEKGFQERDDLMINLKVEPVFDGLHVDPRFTDLVRRIGIPQ
jgi:TolB-like protein/DNA-binding winged helix-turn-helix (wHTH) protein/Tfp pilus assembly protein PilF